MASKSFNELISSMTTEGVNSSEASLDYVRNTAKDFYHQLSENLDGFVVREEQETIIDECINSIFNDGIIIAQAGTGTGKTFAYTLAALPFVKERKTPLIISTHTVALQNQLIEKDIPFIVDVLAPELTFEIAKGSGRYFCPKRSKSFLRSQAKGIQKELQINKEDSESKVTSEDIELARYISQDFANADFNGDLDTLSYTNASNIISKINRDFKSCPGEKKCDFGSTCPFYLQKSKVQLADIIITNHALLANDSLNDFGLYSMLSNVKNSMLVVDEAHHLSDVIKNANQAEITSASIKNIEKNAKQFVGSHKKVAEISGCSRDVASGVFIKSGKKIYSLTEELLEGYARLEEFIKINFALLRGEKRSKFDDENQWLLNFDAIDPTFFVQLFDVHNILCQLKSILDKKCTTSEDVSKFIKGNPDDDSPDDLSFPKIVSNFLTLKKMITVEVDQAINCFQRFIDFQALETPIEKIQSNLVRWIIFDRKNDQLKFLSNNADSGEIFQQKIAEHAQSIVLTSATMESMQSFDLFKQQLSINEERTKTIKVNSPFDYTKSNLLLPVTYGDPNSSKHGQVIANNLYDALNKHKSILVLFCSYKQLNATFSACDKSLQQNILLQKDYSKSELIRLHKANVDEGRTSILFGVDGLSEGIDLKGSYLTCVMITKLPFPNLNSPMRVFDCAKIEAHGGNSFSALSLPLCSIKLIQGVGRLVRTETDSGDIYILDPRISQKYYGQQLLNSLPIKKNSNHIRLIRKSF